MSFIEDVVDDITADISHIGLGTNASTEVVGGGYAHLAPTYAPAAGGAADLASTLEFNGPAATTITHLLFKKGGSIWVARPVDTAKAINADGRIDVTSAEVTAALGA